MAREPRKILLIGIDQAIPCLLRRFVEEGILPNIGNLVENGVLAEAYPCPPCDTPTNWATIATGATTAVHGVTSFYIHIPGEPLDLGLRHRFRGQLSRYCAAEYFWDVADKRGLASFIINYPAGWPGNLSRGGMSLLTWPMPESLPRIVAPPASYVYAKDSEDPGLRITADERFSVLRSRSVPLRVSIKIAGANIEEPETIVAHIVDSEGRGYDSLVLHVEGKYQVIRVGEWSGWIKVRINTVYGELPCLLKVRATGVAPDGGLLRLERTSVYNTKGWARPEWLGEQLVKNAMAYELPEEDIIGYMVRGKLEPYLREARMEALTLARAIRYAKEALGWQICFFHFHLLDSVNHRFLTSVYPKSPLYTEEDAEAAESNLEASYRIVDGLVGDLMRTCVDEETVVVLVSDHGAVPAWRIANIPSALVEAGLLSYKFDNSMKRFLVDWSRTQAFPYLEPTYVWVNLKGREPHGIVPEAEYEEVRERIIEALYSLRDPDTGSRIVKLALRKEEADFLGQDGERVGDVVYFLDPPYEIFDGRLEQLNTAELPPDLLVREAAYSAERCFGAHAYYLPTARLGEYTVSSILVLYGPGIREGVELRRKVNLVDIAPTLSYLLNIPRPRGSQGRVLHETLE